jgi:hypothetical protein
LIVKSVDPFGVREVEIQMTKPDFWDRWLIHHSRGVHHEAWRGVVCVLRWLAIREDNNIPPPGRFHHLEDDVVHSSLLRRLIEGKEPLPEAPPESFGQPWYELMEKGFARNLRVSELRWGRGSHLIINHGLWQVVREESPESCIVTHRRNGQPYRLKREAEEWTLQRLETRPVPLPSAEYACAEQEVQ